MMQVYVASNTDYKKNGDITLIPESAIVHVEMNGTWYAEIEHPIDAVGRWKYIVEENVVKMPSFNGEQLFRIKRKEKSDSGVTATLEPIFFDAKNDCFLEDVRPTEKNGQQALDIMCAQNKKYSGHSDIQDVSTAYYEYMNLLAAINGDQDNSFINRWGGEVIYDNYTVIINRKIGSDNGVELRYGKNIPTDGLMEEVDTSGVVTRIYPKAFNGRKPTQTYFDSPVIGKYPTVKVGILEFEDVKLLEDMEENEDTEGLTVCSTQADLDRVLKERCEEQFKNGIDKPKVTINADMVLLQNTEQYKDYGVLETVSLGDTIHCKNNNIGIITDARVIQLEYDSIQKKVVSVVLGDFQKNYLQDTTNMINRVESAIRGDGSVKASLVSGLLDGVKTQMRAQSSIAKKQNVRAMLFEDLDPDSPTFGAMALGTMGFQIAGERTADGKGWNWTTFGTGQGFFADFITAGTMLADRIQGGTLTLGGLNNVNGLLKMKDAKEQVIGKWDNTGLYSTGHCKNTNVNTKQTADLFNGSVILTDQSGKETSISCFNGGVNIYPNKEGTGVAFMETSKLMFGTVSQYCNLKASKGMWFDAPSLSVGKGDGQSSAALSGDVQFSDGTYLTFLNGILIGGNSKEGAF